MKNGTKKGQLKLYWIPQMGMDASFEVEVDSVDEAVKLHDVLADYDTFQFENKVKPDYSNTGGLLAWTGSEWEEWYSDDDDSFDEYMRDLEIGSDETEKASEPAASSWTLGRHD